MGGATVSRSRVEVPAEEMKIGCWSSAWMASGRTWEMPRVSEMTGRSWEEGFDVLNTWSSESHGQTDASSCCCAGEVLSVTSCFACIRIPVKQMKLQKTPKLDTFSLLTAIFFKFCYSLWNFYFLTIRTEVKGEAKVKRTCLKEVVRRDGTGGEGTVKEMRRREEKKQGSLKRAKQQRKKMMFCKYILQQERWTWFLFCADGGIVYELWWPFDLVYLRLLIHVHLQFFCSTSTEITLYQS